MTDISKLEDWELNEADIDKVLNLLRIVNPDKATPEEAIDFLEFARTEIHNMGHTAKDEDLEKLYERFSRQKPTQP